MFAQKLQNISKVSLLSTIQPKLSADSNYVTRQIIISLDLEKGDPDYILEECEKLLLSARIPSDGLDPFIIEMKHYNFLSYLPNRYFIFLLIASHTF